MEISAGGFDFLQMLLQQWTQFIPYSLPDKVFGLCVIGRPPSRRRTGVYALLKGASSSLAKNII